MSADRPLAEVVEEGRAFDSAAVAREGEGR